MFRFTSIATTFLLLSFFPALSGTLPAHDVTADGTWDCKDKEGETVGAIALADRSYAFIKPDERVAGYGKLFLIAEGYDLPHFAMISGYLKDQMASQGFSMRGPLKSPHDLSGELYLNVILTTVGNGEHDWECVRRKAPAT